MTTTTLPPTLTTAVQRCVDAYYRACDEEDPQNTGLDPAAMQRVHLAYRHAMPYLTPDPDAIDAFIACVTHGIIFGVFTASEGSKLLYAAQVATGSRRARLEAARLQAKTQPQPESPGAPSLTTASSSSRVGNHEPQPTPPGAPSSATARSSSSLGNHQPQPESPGAPSLTTAPSLSRVGNHEPQPTPSQLDPKSQSRANELSQAAAAAPQLPAKPLQRPANQLQATLEELYAGRLPVEDSLDRFNAALKDTAGKRPPTPSPSHANELSLSAAS